MSGHLGTTARLVAVAPASSQQEKRPPRFEIQQARSRRWAFDTSRPDGTSLRSWSVDMGLMSSTEAAPLLAFLDGQWGPGPFWWVSCAAHAGNVLTPQQTALSGLSASGGMDTVDGWSPTSITGPTSTVVATVPVPPGRSVTASMDVTGTATLSMRFRTATGLSAGTVSETSPASTLRRLTVTATVPATARTADIVVSGHVKAARPQLTWTDKQVPYVPGMGAAQVVVQEGGVDPLMVTRDAQWWSGRVEIVEVG